ncbi:hypothetical protein [Acinetobacter sp. YH01006]|uniref:hypothetical protein n=1 Tax=Acinetobacter sp. YH01006 TaxID=2601022 RepID=UPI00211DC100|nr:hypothetical protein [Acinetobacter sp. YH01006]
MDISEKQVVWLEQKPLFEAEFIHSHLLPFFNFNENTGDYEIKSECVNNTDDEDRKVAYETLNTGWVMWLRAKRDAKAQAVPEQVLENNCMIGQAWFMRGTPVSALIKHAEKAYQAEVVAQNSKLEFGTDDNKHWFAHDVPFYGAVQIDLIEEHGLVEWDIHFNGCWQGPFDSKSECIKHLEECIAEEREAAREPAND